MHERLNTFSSLQASFQLSSSQLGSIVIVFSLQGYCEDSSVQFSCSVVSLRPHEPQHASPPCPSPLHSRLAADPSSRAGPKAQALKPCTHIVAILSQISDCLKWLTCNIKVLRSKYCSSSMICLVAFTKALFYVIGLYYAVYCCILKIFNDGHLQNNCLNWTPFFVIVGAACSPRNGCFSVSSVTGSTFRGSLTLPSLASFKMSVRNVLVSFYRAFFTIDPISFPLPLYFVYQYLYLYYLFIYIYFYICLFFSLFDGVNDYWFIYWISVLRYYVLNHLNIHLSSLSVKYQLPTPIQCNSGV